MKTYKLFRYKNGNLYPLYVEANRPMEMGVVLQAQVGELADPTHVKASGCGGKLALRPGFHSTAIPFTDWIGKKSEDGTLIQRKGTVWCECEVPGDEVIVTDRRGSKTLVDGYYYFKTNSRQEEPWVISDKLVINRILTGEEVDALCVAAGKTPQKREEDVA